MTTENDDEALRARVQQAWSGSEPVLNSASMLAAVRAQTKQVDASVLGRLKALSTRARVGIASVLPLLLVGAAYTMHRPDLDSYPALLAACYPLCIGGLLFASIYLALRPFHERELSFVQIAGLAGAALAATTLHSFVAGTDHGSDPAFVQHAMTCFAIGLLAGGPVFGIVRVFSRGSRGSHLLGAIGAALAGHAVLELLCSGHSVAHLLVGHVGVLLCYAGLVFGERSLRSTAKV